MKLPLLLTMIAAVAALSAAQGAPPPDLVAMAAKARVDGQLASWCRGQFRAGRRNAYAAAVTSAAGGGRYLVLDGDAAVVELAPFKGTPEVQCYTPAEARKLDVAIRESETISGRIAPAFATTVVARSSKITMPCAGSIRQRRARSSRSAGGRHDMKPRQSFLCLCLALSPAVIAGQTVQPEMTEFIFESAPFASAHASTIVETREGLVAAWFGGTREGASDVGIWLSRRVGGKWTAPVEVATGVQPDGTRFPTWNPVLFELRKGELALFYKVGPNPREWWGMVRTSEDDGRTWSDARRLPDGILGPIKNKPVRLADGTIIAPSSTETPQTPSTWRVHFERST